MRTWGRDENGQWQMVSTDANGNNDYVWITTLIQCLLLNLGESPFYANYGIPAQQSVLTQIFPDFYVAQTQQQFSQYFASLSIKKVNSRQPTYNIRIVRNNGSIFQDSIPT